MNTKDSYLFTDIELAKEAADYQAKIYGVRVGVVESPLSNRQFIVTRNYTMFEAVEILYIAEAPSNDD